MDDFRIVDKSTLCMEDCYEGIHAIYPVVFTTAHFCLVHTMVHGELINFKFIPPPPKQKLIAKYKQKIFKPKSKNNNENTIIENKTNGEIDILSFAEVLFQEQIDTNMTLIDWKKATEHHLFYINCLIRTYDKLQKLIHLYIEQYLHNVNISSLQSEFDELYPVPNIQIPETFSKTFDNIVHNSSSIIDLIHRFSIKKQNEMTGRMLCHIIGEDVHKIASQVFRIWHFFLSIVPYCKRILTNKLMIEWETHFIERWGACIFRETLTIRDRMRVVSTSLSEHEMISRKVREQNMLQQLDSQPLQDIRYMLDTKQQAVIFEQTYNLTDDRSNESFRLLDNINKNNNKIVNKLQLNKKDNNLIIIHRSSSECKDMSFDSNINTFDESMFDTLNIKKQSNDMLNESPITSSSSSDVINIRLNDMQIDNNNISISRINHKSTIIKLSTPPKFVKRLLMNDNTNEHKKHIKHRHHHRHNDTNHNCIGKHLFVLVHGYQGNSWDMRMFRNHLLVLCQNDLFLMSSANEEQGNTECSISEMGQRLAIEINEYIILNIIEQRHKLCRISFITHSLGGIIAREAIAQPLMSKYVAYCHTFISLAVCHCGYLFGRSKALQAGFWVMRSWKKSLSLSELSLTDNENARKTYMYELSSKPALQYFENVLLVSSPEDRYTPYHSTRIEMHRKTIQDTKWGRVYNEMVRNLLRPLDHVNLTRFDVSFVHRKMNLDSMIGRSAHICFLEQPLYIDMLIHVYKKYFVST